MYHETEKNIYEKLENKKNVKKKPNRGWFLHTHCHLFVVLAGYKRTMNGRHIFKTTHLVRNKSEFLVNCRKLIKHRLSSRRLSFSLFPFFKFFFIYFLINGTFTSFQYHL
jgi:hypothetical protein